METGNMENQMESRPELERGKNGPKMARKMWKIASKIHFRAIFGPFLPLSSPFSILCRPDGIPIIASQSQDEVTM